MATSCFASESSRPYQTPQLPRRGEGHQAPHRQGTGDSVFALQSLGSMPDHPGGEGRAVAALPARETVASPKRRITSGRRQGTGMTRQLPRRSRIQRSRDPTTTTDSWQRSPYAEMSSTQGRIRGKLSFLQGLISADMSFQKGQDSRTRGGPHRTRDARARDPGAARSDGGARRRECQDGRPGRRRDGGYRRPAGSGRPRLALALGPVPELTGSGKWCRTRPPFPTSHHQGSDSTGNSSKSE